MHFFQRKNDGIIIYSGKERIDIKANIFWGKEKVMKNGREIWKRVVCGLLSLTVAMGNLPVTALAEGNNVVLEAETSEEAQEIIQALSDKCVWKNYHRADGYPD